MSLGYRCIRKIGYLLRLRLQPEPGWAWSLAMTALTWIMRLHALTLRYAVEDKPGYFEGRLDGPVIFLIWHNRIVSMPALYERIRQRRRPIWFALVSAGPEGSLLAQVLGHFGVGAVRGSTESRASTALREMARRIAEGHDIVVTPDGPRGPRYRLQSGALHLAQKTGRPIVPMNLEYSRYVRFKTWDGFAVALPFARVRLVIGDPYWINSSCRADEFETERRRLEQIMTQSMLMDEPNVLR